MHAVLIFAFAILALVLIPLAPLLIRLRIRFFRWLQWKWAVEFLEKHFEGMVLVVRLSLSAIAAVLLFAGWQGLGG